MKVGSLFAGVGGFDLAAEAAGMEVIFQSEYDDKASLVLESHWPGLNKGDIHDVTTTDGVDVLCGGFPCQDYSVAGSRSGLAGDRGALWWEFHRLIAEGHPTWVVGENVPGILSSRGGQDFATIIDSLTELGYRSAWRVLDAQYFGVAQRRRRVFIVAVDAATRFSPANVLALAQGMSGDPRPSREARQAVAGTLTSRLGTAGADENSAREFHLQAELIGRNPDAGPNGSGIANLESDPAYTLNVVGGVQAVAFNANQTPFPTPELAPTLVTGDHSANDIGVGTWRKRRSDEYVEDAIAATVAARDHKDHTGLITAFAQNQRDEVREMDVVGAIAADPGMKQQTFIAEEDLEYIVRRLTELECERLQGFPDDWTKVDGVSRSQRYKQMGNAVAVPVVTWIMKRLAAEQRGELA